MIFFSNDDPIWGLVTIAFTFGPAILAFILAKTGDRIVEFILHLPGYQLKTHLDYQHKVLKTDKKAKSCDAKAIKAQSEGKVEEAKEQTLLKDQWELKVHNYQSQLNDFKSHEAMAESFPQTVLQMTIKAKDISKLSSLGFIGASAIVTSFVTLLMTLSGLIVSLPYYVHGKRQIQFKNFSHHYKNILPLTFMAVLPRVMALVIFFSAFYVANAWFAVTILASLILAYFICYWSILYFSVRPKIIEDFSLYHQQISR